MSRVPTLGLKRGAINYFYTHLLYFIIRFLKMDGVLLWFVSNQMIAPLLPYQRNFFLRRKLTGECEFICSLHVYGYIGDSQLPVSHTDPLCTLTPPHTCTPWFLALIPDPLHVQLETAQVRAGSPLFAPSPWYTWSIANYLLKETPTRSTSNTHVLRSDSA